MMIMTMLSASVAVCLSGSFDLSAMLGGGGGGGAVDQK